jgi:hypothetical protein
MEAIVQYYDRNNIDGQTYYEFGRNETGSHFWMAKNGRTEAADIKGFVFRVDSKKLYLDGSSTDAEIKEAFSKDNDPLLIL